MSNVRYIEQREFERFQDRLRDEELTRTGSTNKHRHHQTPIVFLRCLPLANITYKSMLLIAYMQWKLWNKKYRGEWVKLNLSEIDKDFIHKKNCRYASKAKRQLLDRNIIIERETEDGFDYSFNYDVSTWCDTGNDELIKTISEDPNNYLNQG